MMGISTGRTGDAWFRVWFFRVLGVPALAALIGWVGFAQPGHAQTPGGLPGGFQGEFQLAQAAPAVPAVPLVAVTRNDLPPPPLRVGVFASPPFAIMLPNGSWRGVAIELWRETAKTVGRSYEVTAFPSYDALFAATVDGRIDVAVGDLGVSAAEERRLDFLTPYHDTNLGIATRARSGGGLWSVLHGLASRVALEVGLLIILTVIVLTATFWWLERRDNAEIFGDKNRDFLSGAVWTAILLSGKETDLFKMRSPVGRVLGLFLLLVGTTIVASYVALVSSALTVDKLTPQVKNAAGLAKVESGVEQGDTGQLYAADNGLKHRGFASLTVALEALRAGHVAAVIADRADLRYELRRAGDDNGDAGELTILSDSLRTDRLAFAVGQGSKLRESLDVAMLDIVESDTWTEILRHYGVHR